MLSTHSFNALLKTLEEPPEHVKFLLATTDPQKLPVTVLSRCLQFNLKRIPLQRITERLGEIADAESIKAEMPALQMLARAADGSLRDALSLMDQAIAFGRGALPERDVAQMLGALDASFVSRILDALIAADATAVVSTIREADEMTPNYGALLDDLARSLTKIALQQAGVADAPEGGDFPAHGYADQLPAEAVQLYYEIAVHGRRDLALAPDPRTGTEMTLLRMLTFRPDDGQVQSAPVSAPNAPNVAKRPAASRPAAPDSSKTATAAPVATAATSGDEDDEARRWYRWVGAMELDGVARMLAANCAWCGEQDGVISLSLDKRSSAMLTDERCRVLEQALCRYLERDVRVDVNLSGEGSTQTPQAQGEQESRNQQKAAVETLEEDAGVAAFRELMDAKLDPDTVNAGKAG